MKQRGLGLVAVMIIVLAWGIPQQAQGQTDVIPVYFSVSGGFYQQDIVLSLMTVEGGVQIYYTMDGSKPHPVNNPTLTHRYSAPITIGSRVGERNTISMIPTNAPYIYPDSELALEEGSGGEGEERDAPEVTPSPHFSEKWMWLPPRGEVYKATVIRAAAFDGNHQLGPISTHTYFIDGLGAKRYSLPVISLTTDASHLFDHDQGIYVPGKTHQQNPSWAWRYGTGNYHQRGREWERPIHIEIFETDGQRVLAQDAGARIHGGGSRSLPLKSLRLYARDDYGDNYFRYPLFPDQALDAYKRFILRNSGQDFFSWATMFKDGLLQSLVQGTPIDTQAYRPTVVFINGEYWGILNMRERFDQRHIAAHYDVDHSDVVILEKNAAISQGEPGDNLHYQEMITYLRSNDVRQEEHYAYIQTQMDVENYIAYQVAQIYFANTDWPHQNIEFWRVRTDEYMPDAPYGQDGRWRWLLFDTDYGFILPDNNTLIRASATDSWATYLLGTLLRNQSFKQQFINTALDYLNTIFQPAVVLERIDEMAAIIEPEMQEHINRWRYPSNMPNWHYGVNKMRTFAKERPQYLRQHLIDKFKFADWWHLGIQLEPQTPGQLQVNSVIINGFTSDDGWWEGVYAQNVPVVLTALPDPGFRFKGWEGVADQDMLSNPLVLDMAENITVTPLFEADPASPFGVLFINEIVSSNKTSPVYDSKGDRHDWIELYNQGDVALDLEGYFLSDDEDNLMRWAFPAVKIEPRGFLLLWASGHNEVTLSGEIHTNFRINQLGEPLFLTYRDGKTVIDHVSSVELPSDHSYARVPDGGADWYVLQHPSPAQSNELASVGDVPGENVPLSPWQRFRQRLGTWWQQIREWIKL